MSETVKVLCYKSKTLSDGKHPLMVRVCKDGKKKYQSLGISIHPSHWDFKKNEPNESCPNRDEIRMLIQQKLFELQKTILSKRIEGKEFTASSLLKPKVASLSLHNNVEECFNYYVRLLKEQGRLRYAGMYEVSLNSFKKYAGSLDIPFSDIDVTWLKKYEAWMLQQRRQIIIDMKKIIASIFSGILCCVVGCAENIVIKSPEYFTAPIRDGHLLFPDSLILSIDAEEINIPNIGMFGRLGDYNKFPNLRKITFGDVDYLPGGLLSGLPNLEEVVFNGMIGHFDCTLISNCPKLKTVIFKGPVSSTGGPGFLYNLPKLESLVFESVVVSLGVELAPRHLCPRLNGFTNNGAFLEVYNDSLTPTATIGQLRANPRLKADIERIAGWQSEVLRAANPKWMRKSVYKAAKILQPVLAELGCSESDNLNAAMEYAWNLGDDVKSELEILKEAPAYAYDSAMKLNFRYAPPSDSLLKLSRERFNLDSIAGDGDDISRIKNLLSWVHNNITHDGSNGLAPGARNLRNTYDSANLDSCGYNCRALAISLTEALLAEGIPARYITCLPKAWETDNDCHVICVAWSESLDKWVWVDPTFAAFVTDENGMMLHPGEVRHRIQNGLPLVLNKDANWNNQWEETQDDYIDYYMAKNLYILQTNTFNQAEPEGDSNHEQGYHVALVPQGVEYPNSDYNTTDEQWFWQTPKLTK